MNDGITHDTLETAPPPSEPFPWWVHSDGYIAVGLRLEMLRTLGIEITGSSPYEAAQWLETMFQWVLSGAGASPRQPLTPIKGGKQ